MKTRLLIIIGIIVISAAVIFSSYVDVMRILSDEHYEIEITGLKDAYTTDEVYSFDYHVTGYGDGCAEITATYPNEDGKTTTTAREPSCDAGRHFGIIDTSSLHGPLGNIAIKIPGTYKISITYDPIGSLLSTTITKEFEVIDADLFSLTYKDFGISSSEPFILSKFVLMSNYKESWINVSINGKKHLVKYLVLHLMENRYFQLNH